MSLALEPVTLEGRLVRLTPLALEHVPVLARIVAAAPGEFPFTSVPEGEAGLRAYVEAALAERDQGRGLPFATVDRRRGEVVGSTRFGNVERWRWTSGNHLARDTPDVVEIGWTWLEPAARRSGVNTEAKLLMLAHAFETWRVRRVTIKTDRRNARSRAAIERLGLALDGVLRAHMPGHDGAVRDTAFYSVLESEWPAVKARLEGLLAR